MKDVEEILDNAGFTQYGFAHLERPFSFDIYRDWLNEDMAGNMSYLHRHAPQKENPQALMARARSAIVVTASYLPEAPDTQKNPLNIALYARGADYHDWLKKKLFKVTAALNEQWPNEQFRVFVDSAPVLERDLAYRAGLGWIGKNTCLIDEKKGSLNFIGEIYTSLSLTSTSPLASDRCGKCTRCIDICPTGALNEKKLDARKCISYLTIEEKSAPPLELRSKIGDWFFGCDLCQTICPWNQKVWGETLKQENPTQIDPNQTRESLVAELREILTSSYRGLLRKFEGTPLIRAGGKGLKKNAIIVAANRNLHELTEEVKALIEVSELQEISAWALQSLTDQRET